MEENYNFLTEERNKWRKQLEEEIFEDPYYLAEYRKNRESNLWRLTRQVEKICEYVLFLEHELKNCKNKD